MSERRFIYSPPDENYVSQRIPAHVALPVITLPFGTADGDFPITGIGALDFETPIKITGAIWELIFDFGVPVHVGIAALLHINVPGLIRWATYETSGQVTGNTPTHSGFFTQVSRGRDGYYKNPWANLDDLIGTSYTSRFFGLRCEDAPGTTVMGDVWLGAAARFSPRNIDWGYTVQVLRATRQAQITPYNFENRLGSIGKQRHVSGSIDNTDAGRDAYMDWQDACGGTDEPTLFVYDEDVNDAMVARHMQDHRHTQNFIDRNTVPVELLELARGMAPDDLLVA